MKKNWIEVLSARRFLQIISQVSLKEIRIMKTVFKDGAGHWLGPDVHDRGVGIFFTPNANMCSLALPLV